MKITLETVRRANQALISGRLAPRELSRSTLSSGQWICVTPMAEAVKPTLRHGKD